MRARVMLATNAINSFGGGLVLPFLWIYLTGVRGMPATVPAATLALQAASAIGGGLAWGVLVDRVPYRTIVPIVMTVAGVGTSLYAFATTPATALLAAFVYGVGISGVGTVLRTMYAAVTTGPERSVVYSLDYAIFSGMTGVGVIVGGIVATAAVGTAAARYGALYLCDGATFVLTGVIAALLLSQDGNRTEKPDENAAPGSYLSVLRNRRILAVLAVMLLVSFVTTGQSRSGLPGYLFSTGAVGAGGLSFVFALNILTVVLVQFLVVPHVKLPNATVRLASSGVLFAASWLFILMAGRSHAVVAIAWVVVAVLLQSAGGLFAVPLISAVLNDVAEDRSRGRANALMSVTISGGSVLGPVVAGTLIARNAGFAFIAVLVACSLGATALALVLRARDNGSTEPHDIGAGANAPFEDAALEANLA